MASAQTTKPMQCLAISGAASDLVKVWSLLRPTSLQLSQPQWPSNYGTVMTNMHIKVNGCFPERHFPRKTFPKTVIIPGEIFVTYFSILKHPLLCHSQLFFIYRLEHWQVALKVLSHLTWRSTSHHGTPSLLRLSHWKFPYALRQNWSAYKSNVKEKQKRTTASKV